jgi:hypothetical protein
LLELHRTRRDGTGETLLHRLEHGSTSGVTIPMRLGVNGAPARRQCTADFKIRVIDKWLRDHGATADQPATLGMGISLDELQRMNVSREAYKVLAYPLIDLRLTAADCVALVAEAGLPPAPKSACWFCPYHSLRAWHDLKRETPALFDKAVALEAMLMQRQQDNGGGAVFMHDRFQPLSAIVGDQTIMDLTPEDTCESGYCMT